MVRSRQWSRPVVSAAVVLALLGAGCSSGGDGIEEPARGASNGPDRCDLGFNTATFNESTAETHAGHDMSASAPTEMGAMGEVEFSLEQWAEVFVDEELGLTTDEALEEIDADDIYRRHILGGVLTHTLDPEPWTPMTDRPECDALAAELGEARAAAARYPTVADALADGYLLGDRHFAGLGVHYQNWSYLGDFDPNRPVQLLYDGTANDANLVGLSYVVNRPGDVPPDGFTGVNDRWHRHRSFCLDVDNGGVNISSDVLSEEECAGLGGTHVPNTNLWMLHTWVVPGCESDWGTFSGANPRLSYLPAGKLFGPGCRSGRSVNGPPGFDNQGDGPAIP